MKKTTAKSDNGNAQIVFNRKALHDYTIEKRFETGLVLLGWEVKSLRARQAQIAESYVVIKKGEAWLLGAHLTPLSTAAKHTLPEPTRTRKLLLHKKELMTLIGHIERKGYTLIPLSLYWKKGMVKLEIGLAKGKKQHDKRRDAKEKDWKLEKQKFFKKAARE